MDVENSNQPKHDRSRTRWTAALDKIFADLVVKHIKMGNRPNNVFDKKTWNHIREEFNKQTYLNFNNNQLRKHLDVLRTRFYNLKSAAVQNDLVMDDSCCIGFDLWEDFGAQPRPETVKAKYCPIYDQLCTIFMDTSADGKYAQSSHFEGFDKSVGSDTPGPGLISCPEGGNSHAEDPASPALAQGNSVPSGKVVRNVAVKKRKRLCGTPSSSDHNIMDEELNEVMVEALLDMVAASKWRTLVTAQSDEKFSITNCIKALDEIEGIDQQLYFASVDLFEEHELRETFLSLKGDQTRCAWLLGKCGKSAIFF